MSKKLFLGLFMMAMNFVMAPVPFELDKQGLINTSLSYASKIYTPSRMYLSFKPFKEHEATYMDWLPNCTVTFKIDILQNMNAAELYGICNQLMKGVDELLPEASKLDEDATDEILYKINNFLVQQSLSLKIRINPGHFFVLEGLPITKHTLDKVSNKYLQSDSDYEDIEEAQFPLAQ
jgi:hypothetical protein